MSIRLAGSRPPGAWLRPLLAGWLLLALFLQSACATGSPRGGLLVGYRSHQLTPPPAPKQDVTLTPSSDFAPVQLSDAQFRQAFTQLVLEVPLRVAPRPTRPLAGRLVLASWPPSGAGDSSVEGGYARLCERRGSPGDCFWFLGEGPHDTALSHRDRFALALILALTPAVEAATGILQDISAHALTTLLTGLSLYLVVLMAPEPISKGLALAMTLFLWGYLGHELWGLISATKDLWDEAKAASAFHELRDASERYARVLGPNTLRVLILLATWKAGAKGQEAVTGSGLPGFPQAVRNAAAAGHFRLPAAASEATSVSVVEGRLVLTLPSGSGAILAMQNQAEGEKTPVHHIATVENEKSPARGGPWTPKLKKFFDKAGMSMEDDANKIPIPGHKGPHPEAYHQEVFTRLGRAVKTCGTTIQCREALTQELKLLAEQIQRAGSRLNKLVTRSE
ncbi:putative lipoprotein [Cystobacter fuscus DSM 2262]|uniref:Lipoprotein n=1 Tax=Cystobacter fuscus (strain ATCC 25194 / DSM 2262 / NBRC 100088 / M29) TaxID=1242864 RepID=S9PFU6_CYSF2|nr:AHH domain-containing protein [Cystobacter fuscus]EPX61951.1 putative lipoprotein [Cystobacter fuscus DSM 2262]